MITPRQEMACRTCLTPLNMLDGAYIHPIHHLTDGHTPTPVPISRLDTVNRSCDFCGNKFPMWTLLGGHVAAVAIGQTRDLMQDFGHSWAACAPCETDINHGTTDKVIDRACKALGFGHGPARDHIAELHQAFHQARQPGRTLITTTAWPATPITTRELPKVRDRLARFYRGTDRLPPAFGLNIQARQELADSLDRARLYWIDHEFTDLAEHAASQLPEVTVSDDLMPSEDGLLIWSRSVVARRSECR